MANYTMRADGTAANKAAAEDGDPDVVSECMNLTVHNEETFSAGDVIMLADTGGIYRDAALVPPSPGSSGSPITYQAYSGDSPVIYGSINLTSASYKWTASGSGTNEYYCEAAAGGDPGLSEPNGVWMDLELLDIGTVGALLDHERAWGNNDSLGYNTVYIRDDSGDPDTSGVDIEAGNGVREYVVYADQNYCTFDGIDVKHSDGHGYRIAGAADFVIVKNCETSYGWFAGVQVYAGCEDCEINNVNTHHNLAANIGASGGDGTEVKRLLIINCSVHDAFEQINGYTEAAGIKAFRLHESTIKNNTWYNNSQGGVRLDGGLAPAPFGCFDNIIEENLFYGNGYKDIECEFSGRNIIRYNYCHSPSGGEGGIALSHSYSDGNIVYANVLSGMTTGQGIMLRYSAGELVPNLVYNNIVYNCWQAFSILVDYGAIMRNNIAVGSIGSDVRVSEANFFDSDYNCYSSDGSDTYSESGVGTWTLAEWQSRASQELNSKEEDPDVLDAASGKFWLETGSPCIDEGETL